MSLKSKQLSEISKAHHCVWWEPGCSGMWLSWSSPQCPPFLPPGQSAPATLQDLTQTSPVEAALLPSWTNEGIWLMQIMALLQILYVYNVNPLGSFCMIPEEVMNYHQFSIVLLYFQSTKLFFFLRNLLAIICKVCQWENQGNKGITKIYKTKSL